MITHEDLLDRYAQLIVRSGVSLAPGQELLMTAPVDAVPLVRRITERMAGIVKKIGKITKYETTDYVGTARILDLAKSGVEDLQVEFITSN